jgi:CRISPR system Cascade subunit CasE
MHSLHLTRCRVSYELAARWRDSDQQPGFRDSYAWHRRAWDLFPGREEDQRDFLTRLDLKSEGYQLLILSKQAPVRPPWCTDHDGAWETKLITPEFFQHPAYTFSLVANPTRSVREAHTGEKRGRGTRQAVTKREDLVDWMQRKAEAGGFSIDEATLRTSARPRDQFVKQGKPGLHHAVEFTGTLRITDPATFLNTFQSGIGSAKAFGFGMLCIAPLKTSN